MDVVLRDTGEQYTIKDGDLIRLRYYGDNVIHQGLNLAWAQVVRVKRTGSLEVAPSNEIGTRTAFQRHVFSVRVEGLERRIVHSL